MGTILFAYMYLVLPKRRVKEWVEEPSQLIVWRFTQDGMSVRKGAISVEIPWTAVEKVYKFRNAWAFLIRDGPALVLPDYSIDDELKRFIVAQHTNRRGKGNRGLALHS